MGDPKLVDPPNADELPGLQAALCILLVHLEWHLKRGMDEAAEADLINAYCIERRIARIQQVNPTRERLPPGQGAKGGDDGHVETLA